MIVIVIEKLFVDIIIEATNSGFLTVGEWIWLLLNICILIAIISKTTRKKGMEVILIDSYIINIFIFWVVVRFN